MELRTARFCPKQTAVCRDRKAHGGHGFVTLMFQFYFLGIKKPHMCLSERQQVSDCIQEARGRSGRINLTRYLKPCDRMRSTKEEASEDKRPSSEHGTHTPKTHFQR